MIAAYCRSGKTAAAFRGVATRRSVLALPAHPCGSVLSRLGAARALSGGSGGKIPLPPMVYIKGEEMTRYTMELILEKWIEPHMDTSEWEWFDLSCISRDNTEDQVLHDAVASGARIKAIFKEPTVTPTEVQKAESLHTTKEHTYLPILSTCPPNE